VSQTFKVEGGIIRFRSNSVQTLTT